MNPGRTSMPGYNNDRRSQQPSRGGAPKSGSRSPKHRGYRAEEPATEKKARWSAEDRAARGRTTYGTRDSSTGTGRGASPRGERPNWEPRGKDARRTEREWEDRSQRSERPRRFDDR